MNRILVLYGTTEGHTAMIAQTIGDTLKAAGFDADVIRAGTADPRPADYAGIVVAASVQAGGYQKAVGRWVAAHVKEFGSRPTAFVSACLGVLQKDPKVDADLDAIARRFLDAAGWHPTMLKVVAGALLYTQYGVLQALDHEADRRQGRRRDRHVPGLRLHRLGRLTEFADVRPPRRGGGVTHTPRARLRSRCPPFSRSRRRRRRAVRR